MSISRRTFSISTFVLILCVAVSLPTMGQDAADNSVIIQSERGKTLNFASDDRIDLSEEGTIEFWVSHESAPGDLKEFSDENFTNDAYSVVLAMGSKQRLSFAVILGHGTNGPSSIGVVNDLKTLSDPKAYKRASKSLFINNDFNRNEDITFDRGRNYHIALVKVKGDDQIRVYLNGLIQGSIDAKFGKTAGRPLRIGWPVEKKGEADDDNENVDSDAIRDPILYPFDGRIGGLRFWRRELGRVSIKAFYEYGPKPKFTDLLWLTEYGDLIAYADFSGLTWDRERGDWIAVKNPIIRMTDPLAGVWRRDDYDMKESKVREGIMEDYPVYSFIPSEFSADAFPSKRLAYLVFEDANFIGKLNFVRRLNDGRQEWTFIHHATSMRRARWPKITFTHELVVPKGPDGLGRQQWRLKAKLPAWIPGNFSGCKGGDELVLARPTLNDVGVKTWSVSEFKSSGQKEEDMTQVFLLGNNIKYREMLYRGHNYVTMDRVKLMDISTSENKYIIEVPEGTDLFKIDTNTHKITPIGMGFKPKLSGEADTTSNFYSSSREASQRGSDRLGAGIGLNMSGTIGGTVNAAPFGLGATANASVTLGASIDIGFQTEAIKDSMAMDKTGTNLIITNSIYRQYLIYHKKDRMRLARNFQKAVCNLAKFVHDQPDTTEGNERKLKEVFDFYDEWGTHYPLAATFGAMAWWERTVTEKEAEQVLKQTDAMRASLGGKDNGPENEVGDKLKETFSMEKAKARSLGGENVSPTAGPVGPGDKPVPIELDLRPIAVLLTPQHFPLEPDIYVELRKNMLLALPVYMNDRQDRVLLDMVNQVKRKRDSLVVENKYSLHRGISLNIRDIDQKEQDCSVETILTVG